jgi:hypothetical protein
MGVPPQGVGAKIEKESKLGPLAAIIGALATILIVVMTVARASFPVYFYYAAVILLLVAIFSLLIYGFLAHPVYNFIKKQKEIRKHNALARKYFDEFEHFTERFGELLWQSRTVNIPYALRDSQSSQEFRQVFYPSTDDFYNHFRNLLDCFKERLKRFDRTKEYFILLVNEFDTILNMYNEFCLCKPVKEIRGIGRDKVKGGFKEDYKKFKGAYEQFIGNYIGFEKELNREFCKIIFREYFEMPEEL